MSFVELSNNDYCNLIELEREFNFSINSKSLLDDKTVLVTGAGGSIGSSISKRLLKTGAKELILIDSSEINLVNLQRELAEINTNNRTKISFKLLNLSQVDFLERIFKVQKPNVVIHAAAYKHVNVLEENYYQGFVNNVLNTKTLIQLSFLYKCDSFLFVSTDKAVNPTSFMGATKRLGELLVCSASKYFNQTLSLLPKNYSTKLSTMRLVNVVGSSGSVINIFLERLCRGQEIIVTHRDVERYFMTDREVASFTLACLTLQQGCETFVFNRLTKTKIIDLANRLANFLQVPTPKIRITNLLPGEKLCEELLFTYEEAEETRFESILTARSSTKQFEDVWDFTTRLEKGLLGIQEEKLRKLIDNYLLSTKQEVSRLGSSRQAEILTSRNY